jgi:hypothetical protein
VLHRRTEGQTDFSRCEGSGRLAPASLALSFTRSVKVQSSSSKDGSKLKVAYKQHGISIFKESLIEYSILYYRTVAILAANYFITYRRACYYAVAVACSLTTIVSRKIIQISYNRCPVVSYRGIEHANKRLFARLLNDTSSRIFPGGPTIVRPPPTNPTRAKKCH